MEENEAKIDTLEGAAPEDGKPRIKFDASALLESIFGGPAPEIPVLDRRFKSILCMCPTCREYRTIQGLENGKDDEPMMSVNFIGLPGEMAPNGMPVNFAVIIDNFIPWDADETVRLRNWAHDIGAKGVLIARDEQVSVFSFGMGELDKSTALRSETEDNSPE